MYKNTEKERQKMLAQINMKDRIKSISEREELNKKLYLSEIIELEKPEFGSNNLILAPVGSGKSHLIENNLIPKGYNKKILYLTSNTALKDSLCPDDNEVRRMLSEKGESVCFYTSENKSKYGEKPYSVHVMTYAEFGGRITPPHQTFTDDVELIFCDEIHSLPKYFNYDKNYRLALALHWLLLEHKDKQIFYFTATKDSIENLERTTPGFFNMVKTFDYLDHPKIRKYIANSTYYINHISQLRPHLKAKLEAFNYHGYKGLAFTSKISEQKKIEEIAKEEGFVPISLWSINNEEKSMSEEQLKVRAFILNTGLIPEPYNLLIINGAMQEGWNLYDDKVTLAILDTVDLTEQIQALGRIRNDIDFVIKKTKENKIDEIEIKLKESYLNKSLTSEDKNDLCDELFILNKNGRLMKWPTIKEYILKSGYNVEDKIEVINDKRTRVSIITEKE